MKAYHDCLDFQTIATWPKLTFNHISPSFEVDEFYDKVRQRIDVIIYKWNDKVE